MSDWKSFHDYSMGESYFFLSAGDEQYLTHGKTGILRPDAEGYILSNVDCARYFLKIVSSGSLDFCSQQRLSRILLELHERCHIDSNALSCLRSELKETLETLHENARAFFKAQGHDLELDEEELNYTYGYGEGKGCIQYGLSVARKVALHSFIRECSLRLAISERPVDFCGSWKLVITEPKIPAFAERFSGYYGESAHARITQTALNRWEMEFLDFPPFLNWFSLEGIAYKAAAPLMAETLSAHVEADGTLD